MKLFRSRAAAGSKGASPDAEAALKPGGFFHALRALRHRNFRLFYIGQSISMIGTWITRIAMAWLVYRLTRSPWMLGAIGFANQIPAFLLAPLAGVIVDRADRRRLLIATQTLLMAHALLLAAFTLSHRIAIPALFALSIFQGLVSTLDMPNRHSLTIHLIDDREDLPNAIALISSMLNASKLIGPSLAGLLIAVAGEGWCFLVDGVSYGAVILSLLWMRLRQEKRQSASVGVAMQLRQGWTYVSASLPIRSMLLLFALVCLIGMPFSVLMPVFAEQLLHSGPNTLGLLMGALGLGALASAIGMTMRQSMRGLCDQIPWSVMLFGGCLALFAFSHWLWLSLLLLLAGGFGLFRGNNATNIMLQTLVDDTMRGRVMSYFSFSLEGLAPWGSLLAGAMAHFLGASLAVLICGAACILGGLWFRLRLNRILHVIRASHDSSNGAH